MTKKIKPKYFNITIISIILCLFIYINYIHFFKEVSSNSKYLVNYQRNIDELTNYREPQIAVLLYSKSSNYQKPNIIIAPNKKYLKFLYKKYGQNDKNINTIILNPTTSQKQIVNIAKNSNLIPKSIELNSKNLDSYVTLYNKDDHKTNIKNFIKDYSQEIQEIIEKSKKSLNKPFNISKKDYPLSLFDKGNSFVYNKQTEVGSLNNNIGIAQDIANNIFKAKKSNINLNNLKIDILTQIKPISYNNQEELYSKIQKNKHGIILRDGYRQAIFLPHMWQKYKSKKEFIDNLKLKANILPNYTSTSINFYSFETVTIKVPSP